MESIELTPKFILDDNWEVSKSIEKIEEPQRELIAEYAKDKFRPEPEPAPEPEESDEEKVRRQIKEIRIKVAPKAETNIIKFDHKNQYLKSELGMNIILPKGKIEELRFIVALTDGSNNSDKINAIDGFPKDIIDEKHIVEGKIKVAVNKLFKFIPIIGDVVADTIDVELEPWEFKLGSLKKVNVDFSGGLTDKPEWYFKENGIKNDLRVALTIKTPKLLEKIEASVRAMWIYDPGFWGKPKVGTDARTVNIL